MNIDRIKVENFKGLSSVNQDLNGKSVYVIGGNASGKSSFIDAIFCALTGKDIPSHPITDGKRKSVIEVEFGGWTINLEFKKNRSGKITKKMIVFDPNGEQIDSPRSRIDALIGNLDFNPFDFMRMSPKKQMDYFCKVFGVNVHEIDSLYEENNELIRFEKRRLVSLEEQIEPFDDKLAKMELIDQSKVMEEIEEAWDYVAQTTDVKRKLNEKKKRREVLLSELEDLNLEIPKGDKWLENREDKTAEEFESLREKLKTAEETNEEIRIAKRQAEIQAEADKVEETIEKAQDDKKDLIEKKRSVIKEKTAHIEGFDYNGDRFTVDGLPFEENQNNTAAQIVTGLKLGSGLLNDVKVTRFDGSLLDKHNLEEVEKFAKEKGLQLFVEVVDRDASELRFELIENEENDG